MFDEVLLKGIRRNGLPHTQPIASGIPNESVSNMIVLEYGMPESLEYIRQHASELAAVLVEPVQSRRPGFVPIEFLRELREITEQSETALVFDEVMTGFRIHPGGAQALFGIRADLATYGKVAGGGMPIGILAGRAKFMDALDGGMWQYGDDSFPEAGVTFFAGTFVRHPLALAATFAVLQRLKQEGPGLQRLLAEKTSSLVQNLNAFFKAKGVDLEISSFASWFYFSFPSDQPYGSLFYYHLRKRASTFRKASLASSPPPTRMPTLITSLAPLRRASLTCKREVFFPSPRSNPILLTLSPLHRHLRSSFPGQLPLRPLHRHLRWSFPGQFPLSSLQRLLRWNLPGRLPLSPLRRHPRWNFPKSCR